MKKSGIGLFFAEWILSLGILCLMTVQLAGKLPLWGAKPWIGMVAGVLCMAGAVFLHRTGRKHGIFYFLSCVLNGIGCGSFVTVYFSFAELTPTAGQLLLPILPVMAFLFLRCFLSCFFPDGRWLSLLFGALNMACGMGAIVFWILRGGVFFPMLYFALVLEFMQGCGLYFYLRHRQNPWRYLSFASFGYAAIVGLAVLVVLTQGEILDGMDFGGTGEGKKKAGGVK